MREIKFRAWDKDRKVMANVSNINFLTGQVQMNAGGMHSERVSGDKVILLQYTGLKDKYDIEIYEGDVLFHPLQGRRKVYYPYSETVASYGLRNIDNGFGSTLQDSHAVWEVIGNIYENKKVLERDN